MFVQMTKEQIQVVENKVQISKWDTIEKAQKFYDRQVGFFTAYEEENPTYALSTPVVVFKLS